MRNLRIVLAPLNGHGSFAFKRQGAISTMGEKRDTAGILQCKDATPGRIGRGSRHKTQNFLAAARRP